MHDNTKSACMPMQMHDQLLYFSNEHSICFSKIGAEHIDGSQTLISARLLLNPSEAETANLHRLRCRCFRYQQGLEQSDRPTTLLKTPKANVRDEPRSSKRKQCRAHGGTEYTCRSQVGLSCSCRCSPAVLKAVLLKRRRGLLPAELQEQQQLVQRHQAHPR